MKRILLFFAISLSMVLASCSPELDFVEESLRSGTADASFSNGNLSVLFPATSGSVSVDVTATGEWTASFVNDRAKDWCSLSSFEGKKGTVTITVSVKENADLDERSASINFVCGDVRRSIVVTQKQKDALLVSGNRFDFGQEGGKITLEVNANVQFDYAVSENAKSWIKAVGTKGMTSSTLNFEVLANEDLEKRDGEIVVTGSSAREVVKVYQDGGKPTLVLGKDRYELSGEAQKISVDVRHNVDVTMEIPSDCDWVKESVTKSMSTSTFVLDISENKTFNTRSCRISFRSAAWDLTEEVVLEQEAANYLRIKSPESRELSPDGGTLTLVLEHNSYGFREGQCVFSNERNAVVGDDYVFMFNTREFVQDNPKQTTATVMYTENHLRRPRYGYVYLYDPTFEHVDTVRFTQPPLTILTSDPEVFIPADATEFSFRVAGTDPAAYDVQVGPFSYWIEFMGTEQDGDETVFRWKAETNPGAAMRKVEIKIYPVKGGWPDVFYICQEGSGLSFSVTYSSHQVKAPALYGKYREQSTIWWGDGTSQPYADDATHKYSEGGSHTITVRTNSMEYIDWAEVSSFENGMHIDFSNIKGKE